MEKSFKKYTGWRLMLDWKSVISLMATVTSLTALYVSYSQLRIASEEQQASVFPYLTMSYSTDLGMIKLNLRNDGNGPAFISGVSLDLRGKHYDNCWRPVGEFLDTLQTNSNIFFAKNDLLAGWVVRADSENWMLFHLDSLNEVDATRFWQYFSDRDEGAHIKIWFYDLYNNCWVYDFNANRVERASDCPNAVLKR